jgi:hypothetical protein
MYDSHLHSARAPRRPHQGLCALPLPDEHRKRERRLPGAILRRGVRPSPQEQQHHARDAAQRCAVEHLRWAVSGVLRYQWHSSIPLDLWRRPCGRAAHARRQHGRSLPQAAGWWLRSARESEVKEDEETGKGEEFVAGVEEIWDR